MSDSFDVLIVGGGPGGYACAIRAAQLGCTTAVIERDKLGGVCVNVGCIPTKALLQSAHVAELIRRDAKQLGISVGDVNLNLGAAVKRSRRVSEQNSKGVALLLKQNSVTVIPGVAKLLGGGKVQVGGEVYSAKSAIVLATGSRVKGIPQIGLDIDGETVITSDEALFLDEVPSSLAIVGAGAVGMEFADIFNAFGSKVSIIEMLPQILPLEDSDCAEAVAKSYKKRRIDMFVGARITSTQLEQNSVTLAVEVDGEARDLEVEKVLLAAGRALNLEGVGLETAGVTVSETGFVQVDARLQTTAEGVYCIGDIAGAPMLAHKASREGIFVAEVIAGEKPHAISYDNIPSVTYCNPEVASTGLTEAQCAERGLTFTVGRFPFAANGRARASKETDGFVKIIRETESGRILGGHIVASHASELISEVVLAREYGHTAEDIDSAIHAHPTLSEATAEAVLDSLGRAIHQ
jgi:dihydrolipoamide dehydrogenase